MLCSAVPASAGWVFEKQKDLGQDANKMQWYLGDYGTTSEGIPFATVRKYYTGEKQKEETINLLMSKYAIAPDVAGGLYFTEYEYEYTKDGKQFTVTYLRHYNMLGQEIHGTVYNNATEATKRVFHVVDPKSIAGKVKDSAIPPAKAPAKKKA